MRMMSVAPTVLAHWHSRLVLTDHCNPRRHWKHLAALIMDDGEQSIMAGK